MTYRPILFCLLITMMACKSNKALIEEPQIEYENTYAFNFIKNSPLTAVVDKAAEEDKLVFVDIYTDWCLPCQLMNEEVFVDENLGDFFNENFVSYKVNAEQGYGPDIVTLFQVQAYPTLLFLDHKGRIISEKRGMAFHQELKELALKSIELNQNNGSVE